MNEVVKSGILNRRVYLPNQPSDPNDPLRGKKTGKWSKYGGAVHGLVKEQILKEWACQSCGRRMPVELKPFLFELYPGDFIRICNLCQFESTKNKQENSTLTIKRVIKIVRNKRD